MSGLLKTRTVLNLAFWKRGFYVGFGEDDEVGSSVAQLVLTDEAFIDMGCPGQITVTVERGDLLNVEPS